MNPCGKQCHATRADAEAHLHWLFRTSTEKLRRRRRLQVYRCGACDAFHVGHSARTKTLVRKARALTAGAKPN